MVEHGSSFGTDDLHAEEGDAEGFDVQKLREIAGFVGRAPRRHPLLAVGTFVTVAVLGVSVSLTMPKTYQAQAKLLAQRSSAIRALSSSDSRRMDAVDDPTRDVPAMILRRDNLVALVKDADLVHRFEQTRTPALRLKDRVMAFFFGPQTDKEKELGQVYTLEKRLQVNASTDEVDITVDWSDPQIAYDLVSLVQKNFLEARYDSDVAMVNDSIKVLEDHAKGELAQVDTALAEYEKVVADRSARPAASAGAGASGAPARRLVRAPVAAAGSAGVADLDPGPAQELESKRAQILSLEQEQQSAIEGLRRQLLEARLTLTPQHPTVVALQKQIDTLSQPTPELVRLREEERALMERIATPKPAPTPSTAAMAQPQASSASGSAPPLTLMAERSGGTLQSPGLSLNVLERDGPMQVAQSRLAAAARAYEDTMSRVDDAKVELGIVHASFKYRYTVLTPAEMPKKPKRPITVLIGAGSIVAGALLAVLLAAAVDQLTGRIIESWQVKRRLNLDVLGEFDNPS